MTSYTVEHTKYGRLLRRSVPVSDLAALQKLWAADGFDTLALGVASALHATLAVCAADQVEAWMAEVNAAGVAQSNSDDELAWLAGADTGTSSLTIFSVLSEKHGHRAIPGKRNMADVPYDPDDFGRCYRLLERFPAWKARLGEVVAEYPEWAGLVREWDALSALFVEESPTGRCSKLYERMCELLHNGD